MLVDVAEEDEVVDGGISNRTTDSFKPNSEILFTSKNIKKLSKTKGYFLCPGVNSVLFNLNLDNYEFWLLLKLIRPGGTI